MHNATITQATTPCTTQQLEVHQVSAQQLEVHQGSAQELKAGIVGGARCAWLGFLLLDSHCLLRSHTNYLFLSLDDSVPRCLLLTL